METVAGGLSELSLGDDIIKLPLSVQTVVSADDLLTEILLRLPVLSLLLFKSVSKRWLSLIKDTNFVKRRGQMPNIDPPSGLFIPRFTKGVYDFVSFDIRIPSGFVPTFKIDSELWSGVFVRQSCNGLLLCSVGRDECYVYNPTINQFKMIPQPNKSNVKPEYVCGMIMDFDPTKSPHYKVVYATSNIIVDDEYNVSIQMQTYSSETRIWSSVCSDPYSKQCFSGFAKGIYWNDAIHWLTGFYVTGVYKLGIVNKTVVLTRIEITHLNLLPFVGKLCQSRRESLLLLGMDATHFHQLNIYEMRNGHSEWSFKYFVNLDDIMMPISKDWDIAGGVPCIALGEREEDSFMVIGSNAKTIQYNIGLKTYRDLSDPILSLHGDGSFLFIASFAGV